MLCSTVFRDIHTSRELAGSKDDKNKINLQYTTDPKSGRGKEQYAVQSVTVSLFNPDGTMIVTTLVEAERLAQRRNLRLMKHPDKEVENKFKRPAYKLVTSKEYFESSEKAKKKSSGSYIKGETIFELSHRISENDLQVKIKGMVRNLKKGKQVQLSIAGSETSQKKVEALLSMIRDGVLDIGAKMTQGQKKGHDIKCLINPARPKKDSSNVEEATSDSEA
ncbi:Translation initiation factor 3 C-terminal [Trinorchestia longiramus]|nr:Translation initiation factor 3 C-terminal [Trinorchestia longiramus]